MTVRFVIPGPLTPLTGGRSAVEVQMSGNTLRDALRSLLRQLPCGCAIYAGDDDTDEHVFDLPDDILLGMRVGAREASGATLYVDGPELMLDVVEYLNQAIADKR